jgi:hypothetical protein
MLDHYHRLQMKGEPRPFPLPILAELRKDVTQTAGEMIVVDDAGNYMLARRPKGETKYGGPLLYVVGGFFIPAHRGELGAVQKFLHDKHDIDAEVTLVAGPVAKRFWLPEDEHPEARNNLITLLYVMRLKGTMPAGRDVQWFPIGTRPPREEFITGRPGVIHAEGYVPAFHSWNEKPYQPCIDLNALI